MASRYLLSLSLTLLFTFSNLYTRAQFSGVKWQQKFLDSIWYRGDHAPLEAIRKVITNKKGDVYVIGRQGWPNTHAFSMGLISIYKFDREKNFFWKNRTGMVWYGFDDFPTDVVEVVPTNDDGIIVLTVNPTTTFGVDTPDVSQWAGGDIYLCKYSSNGMLEWEQNIGGTRWDHAYSLDIDRYGNILIAGRTWSATNHFSGLRRSLDTSSLAYKTHAGYAANTDTDTSLFRKLYTEYMAMNDAFVAKVSPTGKLMNIKCFGGSAADKLAHILDHPVNGYVAVGYSDSKDMDLPQNGVKGGLWMLHLDTALNILQNKILDSTFIGGSSFFVKEKKMYLSDPLKFRELDYDGTIKRAHNVNGVKFDVFSYFDASGYIYKPADNQRMLIYDSTLQLIDSVKFPGWDHGYFSIEGTNRNNLYLIGNNTNFEFRSWPPGSSDPDWDVYSNAVINFADQFNYFRGIAYVDNNKNNLFDIGDASLEGIKVEAQKHNNVFTVTTGSQGKFSLPLDTGNYSIKVASTLPYYNIFPASANVQFTSFGGSDSINFALQPIPNKKDLAINLLPLNIPRPGFEVSYRIVGYNKGTVAIPNVQVKMLRDTRVNYLSAVPVVSSTNADTLIWNIGAVEPLDSFFINIKGRVKAPPAVNNSDTLIHKVFVQPVTGDEVVADNETKLVERVQGSYDPNDKTETHGGIITPEQLAGNDYLTYLIRFQNTGTDTAFNVMIRDTLTNKLDWSSFEMISSSHTYQLYMIKPHILEFSFPNILLVDSNRNEPASHGFVAYRIKPKSNLLVGDTVFNRAHIFFDYNLPVITNNEQTILRNTVITSVIDLNRPDNRLLLYPNPSNGLITVSKKDRMAGKANLYITDMNGRLVHQTDLGHIAVDQFNQSIDISDFSRGIYIVKLQVGKVSFSTKFILQ